MLSFESIKVCVLWFVSFLIDNTLDMIASLIEGPRIGLSSVNQFIKAIDRWIYDWRTQFPFILSKVR